MSPSGPRWQGLTLFIVSPKRLEIRHSYCFRERALRYPCATLSRTPGVMAQLDRGDMVNTFHASKGDAPAREEVEQKPVVKAPEPGLEKGRGPEGATAKALMLAAEAKREQEARAEAERLAAAAVGNVPLRANQPHRSITSSFVYSHIP